MSTSRLTSGPLRCPPPVACVNLPRSRRMCCRTSSIVGGHCGRWGSSTVSRAGCAALVIKVHHARVDGVRGTQLYEVLFDLSPDAPLERSVARSSHPNRFHRPRRSPASAAGVTTAPLRAGRALHTLTSAGVRAAGFHAIT